MKTKSDQMAEFWNIHEQLRKRRKRSDLELKLMEALLAYLPDPILEEDAQKTSDEVASLFEEFANLARKIAKAYPGQK